MKDILILFLIYFCPYVCSGQETSIGSETTEPLYSNIVESHKDYYVFKSSKRTIQLDTEEYLQPGYIIHLPKKIKEIFTTSTNCVLNIGQKQSIYINSSFQNKRTRPDSVYIPSLDETDRIVRRVYVGHMNPGITEDNFYMIEKWNDNDERPQNNRRDLIISREGIVILMLNIKKNRFEKLYELLNNSLVVDY